MVYKISSGIISSGIILNNDQMCITSGGVANSTTVYGYGGCMCIESGGVANSTTCYGGNMQISSGGVANSTAVGYNGYMIIDGVVNNTTVNYHGLMNIYGVANSTTVNSGGIMDIGYGGVANSTTVNSAGRMYISRGGVHRGSLNIADGAEVSVSEGSVIDFTVSDRSVDDGYLINNLSLISCSYGSPTYTITVSADQAFGTYKLAQGAGSFTRTISVGNGTTDYGMLTVNGSALKYNGVDYLLNQTNGNLVLAIGDFTAPELNITGNPTVWTNQNVVLKAVVNEDGCTIQYQIGNGEWLDYIDSITITANGTVNFKVTDKGGHVTEKSITVDKIDKIAPTLNISGNTTAWTNKDVTLTATVSDGTVEFFNGTKWVAGDKFTVSTNGTYKFRVTDQAGNVNEKSVTVDKIDKVNPTLDVSGNPTSWTNQDVTLTATYNEGSVEFFNCSEWVAGAVHTVSENGTYKFRVTDLAGNVTEKEITVDKIDKVVPTLNITGNPTAWTNKDVTLTATVSDGTVKFYNGIKWVSGDKQTVSANGTYKFRVTDLAGNVTEKEVVVDKIDKVAPTLNVSGNPTAWTNKNVTLTATVSDGTVEYFNGSKWVAGNKYTVSANGTYKFRVTDQAGNVTEKSVTVDKIDKVNPTLDVSGDPTSWTNQDVTLTATYNEGSVEFFNGSEWVAGAVHTVSENCTYKFRVTDLAGNITEKSVIVDKIDKVAPTLKITGNAADWTNEDVILTAIVSDGTVEFFNGKKWVSGTKHSVAENGTYKFRVTDAAGNVTEKSVTVDKIDKVDPTLDVSGNPTEWTNKDIVLTATASDGSVEYFNGTEWISGNKITVSENGTYKFRVTDRAGNVTEKEVVVDKINKEIPDSPVLSSNMGANWSNSPVTITATAANDTVIEYSFDKITWYAYENGLVAGSNGEYYFRATDTDGYISAASSYVVDKIDPVADLSTTEYIFIKAKYNEKITGKKQNGVVLEYKGNAFNSIADVPETDGKLIVAVDSKVNGNEYAGDLRVAANAVLPKIKETDNSYSYSASAATSGTLNITASTGKTEFIRFATVNVAGEGVTVESVTGGKSSHSENLKTTVNKKGVVSDSAKLVYSEQATGKVTITAGANVKDIAGYSNVTLTDSVAGDITNFTSKDSKSDTATYDEAKNSVTRKVTLSHTETTAGTLKATNSTLGDVTGFATVTLKDVDKAGDFRRVDSDGNKYSTIKKTLAIKTNKDGSVSGTYSKTETFTRAGKFTATGSTVGDIENFSNVTLDGSKAEAISNFVEAKIVTTGTATWENAEAYGRPDDYAIDLQGWNMEKPVITEPLNGSVTLKNGASATSITDFKSVTMTASEVGTIENVEKVTVNKGDSAIESYIGTDGNDTLTIAKGAVLTANKIDLGKGDKDKLAINGTLILTGTEIKAANITGKGEIAATATVWDALDMDETVLNLGETAENFRGTAYENADDSAKKAVKWDGKTEYNGWLGDWSGAKAGSDTVDYIKFKAQDGYTLNVSGDVDWVLLDKKGNEIQEIAAGVEYTIQITNKKEGSSSYTIELA